MPARVVAETAGEVVDALFFDQTICVVVGKAVGRIVFVGQGNEAYGLVVFVSDGLAFAIGVGQDLAQFVVGKGLAGAIRVVDAQHFAVGLALQGGVVQRVCDGHQIMALVISVVRAFCPSSPESARLERDHSTKGICRL